MKSNLHLNKILKDAYLLKNEYEPEYKNLDFSIQSLSSIESIIDKNLDSIQNNSSKIDKIASYLFKTLAETQKKAIHQKEMKELSNYTRKRVFDKIKQASSLTYYF